MAKGKDEEQAIQVNQILGGQPRLGPVPANQILPWAAFSMLSYIVCLGLLNLGLTWMLLMNAWLIATWWILTGEQSWKFLSGFYPPKPNWIRGTPRYQRMLTQEEEPWLRPSKKSAKSE